MDIETIKVIMEIVLIGTVLTLIANSKFFPERKRQIANASFFLSIIITCVFFGIIKGVLPGIILFTLIGFGIIIGAIMIKLTRNINIFSKRKSNI